MGRPARNHGGTGGHGCLPLPGERPNFHRHLLKDKTLTTLVKSSQKEPKKTKKVEIVKPFKNDDMKTTLAKDSNNKTSLSEKELPASEKQKEHVTKEMLNLQEGTKQGLSESSKQLPKKIEQSSDMLMQNKPSSQESFNSEEKLSGPSASISKTLVSEPVSSSEKDSEPSKMTGYGHTPKVELPGCSLEKQSASKQMLGQLGEKQEVSGPKTFILESVVSSSHFAPAPFVNLPMGHFFPANQIYTIPVFPPNFFVQPQAYKQANNNECNFEVPTNKVQDSTMTPEKMHSEPKVQQSPVLQCDLDHNLYNRSKSGVLSE